MRYNFILTIAIFLISVTISFGADSVRLEQRKGEYFIIHEVDESETLYSIARRYRVEIKAITLINEIIDNNISMGQILEIPFVMPENKSNDELKPGNTDNKIIHEVKKGQTLYTIAKKYNVTVDQLIEWNELEGTGLSTGQKIVVLTEMSEVSFDTVSQLEDSAPSFNYYVQTGETLSSIATKFDVDEDSIKIWNNLNRNRVKIGQILKFPFAIEEDSVVNQISEVPDYSNTAYGSKMRSSEEGGVTTIIEEGIAKKIDSDNETSRFLILHRTLKVGSFLKVKNIMNNKYVYVRVVGKLPETGINSNTMIRMTGAIFERLEILDDKALVEITYFN